MSPTKKSSRIKKVKTLWCKLRGHHDWTDQLTEGYSLTVQDTKNIKELTRKYCKTCNIYADGHEASIFRL